MLQPTTRPLADHHDVVVLDLDGVVYIGGAAVPQAVETLGAVQATGVRLAFITNNASRTPEEVAVHLQRIGVPARPEDVVTSAQAAARLLEGMVPPGSRVYLIGGEGLATALRERGLEPVTTDDPAPAAVVQGYGPEMPWKQVVLGAILVRSGLPWVASNTDMTIPIPAGIGPGNGALVELVSRFAQRQPVVAGKPSEPLFTETRLRLRTRRPLMVGDRLDTDIGGARAAQWPSLLVMTGVTDAQTLASAPPSQRPDFISADLRGLQAVHGVPHRDAQGWHLGGWRSHITPGGLVRLDGSGSIDDWWRCLATAAWSHLDLTRRPADVTGCVPPPDRLSP